MRLTMLCTVAVCGALLCGASVNAADVPAALHLVYAVTKAGEGLPSTTLYVHQVSSGQRSAFYRDRDEESRVLVKIAGSDVLGAARAIPPRDVYVMVGPAAVERSATCSDTLTRLRIAASDQEASSDPLFLVPLCFSEASPYGLWNRAPVFAVSRTAERTALSALRIGDTKLDGPAIRVLSREGAEEWQVSLGHRDLYLADLVWSPDSDSLAYLVMPLGDVHTLDEALLPKAGIYLADISKKASRHLYHCYGDALAWGPKPNCITVAARTGDFWGTGSVIRVIQLPSGRRIEEYSVPGRTSAIAYSDNNQWLSVQTRHDHAQQLWLYAASGGYGRLFCQVQNEEGRLALLGWARLTGGGE